VSRVPVAVTGVGVVSVCGIGGDAFWKGLFDPPPIGRERRVEDFDASPYYKKSERRRVDRFAQFGVAASMMALDDGGDPEAAPERSGVVIGTGIGGLETLEAQIRILVEQGERYTVPYVIPMIMANAAAAETSMKLGWRGPCETITTACASGTHSIAAGARLIETDRCDVVLAGASEAPLAQTGVMGFARLTALSLSGTSRPFDAERDGFVISEGAAVLLLEREDRALARGAHVYARIAGAASTADAYHITKPQPAGSGAVDCMRLALDHAGVAPDEVAHVNAHGTSTEYNDAAEAVAIREVFGRHRVPVTSIKGATGHALGAGGAIEAASCVLAIENGVIPPTIGFTRLGDGLDIDVVATATPFLPGPVLSNSFAFGGHNGALVFTPPTRDRSL
jgi:3-oxoacyl-[acyl-carrier-protein] synthase II